jgi:hypothetical protein
MPGVTGRVLSAIAPDYWVTNHQLLSDFEKQPGRFSIAMRSTVGHSRPQASSTVITERKFTALCDIWTKSPPTRAGGTQIGMSSSRGIAGRFVAVRCFGPSFSSENFALRIALDQIEQLYQHLFGVVPSLTLRLQKSNFLVSPIRARAPGPKLLLDRGVAAEQMNLNLLQVLVSVLARAHFFKIEVAGKSPQSPEIPVRVPVHLCSIISTMIFIC